jgi:hypothetical protein
LTALAERSLHDVRFGKNTQHSLGAQIRPRRRVSVRQHGDLPKEGKGDCKILPSRLTFLIDRGSRMIQRKVTSPKKGGVK